MKILVAIVVFSIAQIIVGIAFGMDTKLKDDRGFLRVYALEINVDDMDKALGFYVEKLGFEVVERSDNGKRVYLKSGGLSKLALRHTTKLRKPGKYDTFTGMSLQVNNLDRAIAEMKAKAITTVGKIRKVGVGRSIYILDPFGRKISLLEQTIVKVEPFAEPKLYNFGVTVPDINSAREFYSKILEFVVRSEDYLPYAIPLGHKNNTFAFMIHYRNGVISVTDRNQGELPFYTMVFSTVDLDSAIEKLKGLNVKVVDSQFDESGVLRRIVIEDPFGNTSAIVEKD